KARRETSCSGREVVGNGRFEIERRVERQAQVRTGPLHVLRDSISAADHPGIARPPGEADPRLEALHVDLVERASLATAGRCEDLLACRQIEIRLTVVLLDKRLRVRPPHPEIERE